MLWPKDLVAALRSGKYRKGSGSLCDNEGRMCCLGVAAVVAGVPEVDLRLDYDDDGITWDIELPVGLNPSAAKRFESEFPWLDEPLAELLACENDATDDWEAKVIPHLESLQASLDEVGGI